MLKILLKIKEDYLIDSYSILLFVIVSFSFKNVYKFLIPLLILISIIQFYRLQKNRISKDYFFKTYFYLLIYATVFHRSIQTVILITLLVFLATLFIKIRPKKRLKFIQPEIFILVFFALISINLTIFNPQLKGLEKYLYLLFFPIGFILLKKLSFTIDKLKSMRLLILSILISSAFLIIINLFDSNISFETNTFFPEYLELTHVYYGMFLGVAGCFLIILNKEKKYFINFHVDIFLFLFFITLLVYIGARISLLSLLLILVIVLFQKVPLPWFLKSIFILVFGSIFLFFTYNTIPRAKNDISYVQKVYNSVKDKDKEDLIQNSWRNIYQRFLVTTYTVDKIKEKPLLGVGMQNVKEEISDEIINDGYQYFEPINSHNQYLQIWVGMGLFSFLYFLIMLYNFYKLQTYSLYFLTFFLIIMLTESLLVRVKGISLFFLFSLIFSFKESRY